MEGWRRHLEREVRHPLVPNPSTATTLDDGFGHVSSFFPGTKILAADLMEYIVSNTLGGVSPGSAGIFDDQYISTRGQMVELMLGRDRFCCDLRPLFFEIAGRTTHGLECHPYDVAGALVAREAGVILTDGIGHPLDCPLSVVHGGVHWCGYANESIRRSVAPVLNRWLDEHGIRAESAS